MQHTPTAFDKVAQKFWQDYNSGLPIGGAMAYENEVRHCQLDESVESLNALDELLSTIKNNLQGNEQDLLRQTPFRNFLLFLGFYVGRVVARHYPDKAFCWLSFDELKGRYRLTPEDKFFKMAALCADNHKPFFVWINLGAKLFGTPSRRFTQPLSDMAVSESLYWATQAYFDELDLANKRATQIAPQTAQPTAGKTAQNPAQNLAQSMAAQAIQAQNPQSQIQSKNPNQPQKSKRTAPPAKDPFDEVKADLVNLPAQNSTHDEHYKKAHEFLQKVDKDMQGGLVLDDKQQANAQSALNALEKIANAGNTNAMLSLAVYAFEGRLMDDTSKATAFVQRAADGGDVRAQKLLSRLYYQGLGVKTSTEMGQMWLDRAAQGGHPEAKKLQMQMSLVKDMKNDYHSEIQQDKRMYLMVGGVGLFFVILIWLSTKFLA